MMPLPVNEIICGDCLDVMRGWPDNCVDATVCDPPYELGFMGKAWDSTGVAYSVEVWAEVLRVLKPGGHLLAFGGTRTYHRMVCAIEDAGFEIRDQMQWIYGSGFPKSLDVGKAIDKVAGAMREVVGTKQIYYPGDSHYGKESGFSRATRAAFARIGLPQSYGSGDIDKRFATTAPATDAAKQWDGWGTALKPAHEPICVARKPFKGTVAANVLEHGTGALNIDGCRVGANPGWSYPTGAGGTTFHGEVRRTAPEQSTQGRFPANVILDEEAGALLDAQSGKSVSKMSTCRGGTSPNPMSWGDERTDGHAETGHSDSGGASRFFYCAKASRKERNVGLEGLYWDMRTKSPAIIDKASWLKLRSLEDETLKATGKRPRLVAQGNIHPTVKVIRLMAYLVRLVTPPGGIVLDPFVGSGTTCMAAKAGGFCYIGIECSWVYYRIAKRRVHYYGRWKGRTKKHV